MAASLRITLLMCCCLLGVLSAAQANEQLSDPTRPSFELVPGLTGNGMAGDAIAEPAIPAAGLQSVIISPKREAAIINGTEVELGDKFGDAMLTVVNETCVVLVGPQGRQVMHMFPTVNLTKNEMACVKRLGMKPIGIASTTNKRIANAPKKKAKAKKRAVICAPEETKDGSKK
jgi:hypothetical protein